MDIKQQTDKLVDAMTNVFGDIAAERIRQNIRFAKSATGAQHHNILTWAVVLAEESGEAAKAALDSVFPRHKQRHGPVAMFATEEVRHLREELVQTAAVAVAMIERIDARDESLFTAEGYFEKAA